MSDEAQGATYNYQFQPYQQPYNPYGPNTYPVYPNGVYGTPQGVLQIPTPENLRLKALELALSNDPVDVVIERAERFHQFLLNETDTKADTPTTE